MVDLRRNELPGPLREIPFGVGTEHLERHPDASQVAVILVARIGIGADGVAEVVERRGVHHRIEVDDAEYASLTVEEDVVDFRIVVRDARGNRPRLDQLPEAEHLLPPCLDPVDLLREVLHTAGGIAAQRLVPLAEPEADVVESRDGLRKGLREVGEL